MSKLWNPNKKDLAWLLKNRKWLFWIFIIDLIMGDPIPLIDEILLGLINYQIYKQKGRKK